jgi:tetratricopeptide (TPR) repeat protein
VGTYPKEIIPLALETIMKAMEIDNSMGESYQILGLIKFYQLDFTASEKYLLKAIELNPNYLESYVWLANLYSVTEKVPESKELFDKAISLDPSAINYRFLKTNVSYYNRDYTSGIAELESSSELMEDTEIQWLLAALYFGKGEYDKSIKIYQNRSKGNSTNWALGYVYGITGKTDSANYILDYLLEKRRQQYVPGYMISSVYAGLGEYDKALEWLETAYDDGPDLQFIYGVLSDPRLDSIANDPRYLKLRKKLTP